MIKKTRHVMEQTQIRATNVKIPRVVFGTSAFGNLYQQTTDECRRAIVEQMLQHIPGTIALDSAGKYGAGLALETLGETLSQLRVPKERVLISNKLGWRRVELRNQEPTFEPGVWMGIKHDAVQDISYDGILRCWEEGNRLLGEYNCQLVSVHDPDEYLATASNKAEWKKRWEDILDAYRALRELRENGLAQAIGVGSKDWRVAKRLVEICDLDWVMLANSLTVFRHEPELLSFVDSLQRQGILVINSAIFHGGFLVGSDFFDYRKIDPNVESDSELISWRRQFFEICDQFNASPAEVCANFAVSHPGIAAIALNTSRPAKVMGNLELPFTQVDDQIWAEMKSRGLLSAEYSYLGVTV